MDNFNKTTGTDNNYPVRSHISPLITITTLFFMWGFITSLNDILTPYLKGVFQLSHFQANLVQFSFFGAYFIGSLLYFISSVTIGDPISKIGYKNGIMAGLILSAAGCFLFYPSAHYQLFGFFLGALACISLGLTILQIAANPYVALLGKPETASSRLNLSQGFNSFGHTIAPVIGGYLIFKYFLTIDNPGANSVKIPYFIFGSAFLLLALLIRFSHLPSFAVHEKIERKPEALKHLNLLFGIFAVFFYVGAEVSVGSNLVAYLKLPDVAGMMEADASKFLAFYWGGAMIGRFMGSISLSETKGFKKYFSMVGVAVVLFLIIFLITKLEFTMVWFFLIYLAVNYFAFILGRSLPARTLTIFSFFVMALLLIGIFADGRLAMWSMLSIGLFNSIMWSNIFTLAIAGLDKYTSQGSSLLVMMIVGGAILPLLQGALADASGVHISLFVPLLAYLYLIFYGLSGYRKRVRVSHD
ncbi:MAG: sugar MFS transporter [Ignavibacteria bacterium]|jgi:FHS family L-fucose permease-like MFS transporter